MIRRAARHPNRRTTLAGGGAHDSPFSRAADIKWSTPGANGRRKTLYSCKPSLRSSRAGSDREVMERAARA